MTKQKSCRKKTGMFRIAFRWKNCVSRSAYEFWSRSAFRSDPVPKTTLRKTVNRNSIEKNNFALVPFKPSNIEFFAPILLLNLMMWKFCGKLFVWHVLYCIWYYCWSDLNEYMTSTGHPFLTLTRIRTSWTNLPAYAGMS